MLKTTAAKGTIEMTASHRSPRATEPLRGRLGPLEERVASWRAYTVEAVRRQHAAECPIWDRYLIPQLEARVLEHAGFSLPRGYESGDTWNVGCWKHDIFVSER